MNLAQLFFERNKDNLNLAYQDSIRSIDYNTLQLESQKIARVFSDNGLKLGDIVAINVSDSIELVTMILGVWFCGGVVTVLNSRESAENLNTILKIVNPKFIINQENFNYLCSESHNKIPLMTPVEKNLDSLTTLWFTSGTTGRPKAVMHTAKSHLTSIQAIIETKKLKRDDRLYSIAKLFFGYGFLYNILVNLYLGSTALLDSDLAIPSRVKNKLDEFKPTWFLAVPIIYSQLLDKISHDMSDITFVSSGDRLPQKLLDNWYTKTLTRIHNELGATEFSVITYNQEGSNIDIGSAINGYSIRVVDENNNEIEKGSIGRLQVFGNSMSVGYYSDEILTKSTFLDTNWANTNDMIFKDDNGKLYHLGRANDIIKTSRGFISPSEIEEVILSYFGIDQVAVISKPDENGVEYIEAHIVLSQGIDFKISGLKLWIKTKLNHCSVPSSIIIDESLPRTQTGKIQRYRLKEK